MLVTDRVAAAGIAALPRWRPTITAATGLRAAFEHDGAALVDVRTARYELALPRKLTYSQIKGFTSTPAGPSCPAREPSSSSWPRPTCGS
jgi:hypothetical protein